MVEAPGVSVVVSGGQSTHLADLLGSTLGTGAAGIVSFGLCGGLDPLLGLGEIIIDSNDLSWSKRLLAVLPRAQAGAVAGGDTMIASAAEKASLHKELGALAVDMETHVVRDYANRLEIPYAVVRAVSDTADRALPRAALAGLKANGETDIFGVVGQLARRPWELPSLLQTAREANVAFASLRNARDLLGPGLGCPYFLELLVHMR